MEKDTGAEVRFRHRVLGPFLAAVAVHGNVTIAARQTADLLGMPNYDSIRRQHYKYMHRDDEVGERYRQAFEDAMTEAAEHLEAEARRRAVEGVVKPVYYKGQEVGAVREYSDTLLIFLLKGAMPEKYRERYEAHHSGSMELLHNTPFAGMTLDEIAAEVEAGDEDSEG